MAHSPFARLCGLYRAGTPNGTGTALDAHSGNSPPQRARQPHTIPRAPACPGIARARAEAPRALAGLRRVVDFWRGERSVCVESVPMVRPADWSPQASLGSWVWPMVDDPSAFCRSGAVDGELAEGRTGRLDQPGKLTGTSGEREKECLTTN